MKKHSVESDNLDLPVRRKLAEELDGIQKDEDGIFTGYVDVDSVSVPENIPVISEAIYVRVKHIILEKMQIKTGNRDGDAKLLKESLAYIIEKVMDLSPVQFDALYNTEFIKAHHLDNAIRQLTEEYAPSKVAQEGLFLRKNILFLMLYPDYYRSKYPRITQSTENNEDKVPYVNGAYTPADVFFAKGEIKGALKRAGAIKEHGSYGRDVDRVLYWAMSRILPSFGAYTTEQLFLSLCVPRQTKFVTFGCIQVIMESRKNYETPLDFYFLNSPPEYQAEHFGDYIRVKLRCGFDINKNLLLLYKWHKEKGTIKDDIFEILDDVLKEKEERGRSLPDKSDPADKEAEHESI